VLRERLAVLACPSVAVWTGAAPAASTTIVDAFDVVVDSAEELAAIGAAVEKTPLAATALVQLLRHSDGRRAHDGLIAESLVYSTLQSGPEYRAWLDGQTATPAPAAVQHEGPAVLVARSQGRLELTLNRPDNHNAFSAEMRDALVAGLQLGVADPSIGEIVLRGNGRSFCSGGDLGEFGTLPDPATAHVIRSTRNAARVLAGCADRVLVELHGACIGAGIELPAFAARIVARPDAYFQLPELSMGLVPGAGGTASIPRRIGRQRTAYMAITGRRFDTPTALAWGLIDEIAG
jgi:enoyl-CoA hydratase